MPSAIIESEDGVVRHHVLIVEDQGIEPDTGSEFEFLVRSPFFLTVETYLVETHPCCRGLFAVISVGNGHRFRNSLSKEVLKAAVTVVSCTVSHI